MPPDHSGLWLSSTVKQHWAEASAFTCSWTGEKMKMCVTIYSERFLALTRAKCPTPVPRPKSMDGRGTAPLMIFSRSTFAWPVNLQVYTFHQRKGPAPGSGGPRRRHVHNSKLSRPSSQPRSAWKGIAPFLYEMFIRIISHAWFRDVTKIWQLRTWNAKSYAPYSCVECFNAPNPHIHIQIHIEQVQNCHRS